MLVIVVVFLLEGCLFQGRIVSWGCFHAWLSGGTCFAVEPEVLLIVDRGVGVITKMGDARLSTGNGGPKEKMKVRLCW